MGSYVALLRGINVGGKNVIRMADLKACFERHGFEQVTTYIQSGNVVFVSPEPSVPRLTSRIEEMLAATFDYDASVILRTGRQLRAIVEGAPDRFGADASRYRYDVIFLKAPLTARTAARDLPTKEGVDRIDEGKGVLYGSRLISAAAQSRLSRITALPIYPSVTIRNWNTTTKLLQMVGR